MFSKCWRTSGFCLAKFWISLSHNKQLKTRRLPLLNSSFMSVKPDTDLRDFRVLYYREGKFVESGQEAYRAGLFGQKVR